MRAFRTVSGRSSCWLARSRRIRWFGGQQLSAGKDGRGAILIDADADERERAIGWRRGEIVLSGEPLDAVLSEYNRYLTHKIVIGDPQLRSIRMGGRFTSNDPAEFLSALHASFGIVARRQEEQTLLFAQTGKNFPV
jgi:transmembrane sensor